MSPTTLTVLNLGVKLVTADGRIVRPVRDVSLNLHPGTTLGVVGESGSGKSTLALALTKLHSPLVDALFSGEVRFGKRNLLALTESELRKVRGRQIGYVFQDPEASLDPTRRVGNQIVDVIRTHRELGRAEAFREAVDLLERVGIDAPDRAAQQYPHEFSGGMKQRVVIAVGVANNPTVLVADEPTSYVDVLVQERILDLLAELRQAFGMSMIFISHDLRLVSRISDHVMVMYGGRVAEIGPTQTVLSNPQHWYTVGLLKSVPDPRLHYEQDHRFDVIEGTPVQPDASPPGCPFAERCSHAQEICHESVPPLIEDSPAHYFACWFPASGLADIRVKSGAGP